MLKFATLDKFIYITLSSWQFNVQSSNKDIRVVQLVEHSL